MYDDSITDSAPFLEVSDGDASLESVIDLACKVPGYEDAYGRNGLHYVAYASMKPSNGGNRRFGGDIITARQRRQLYNRLRVWIQRLLVNRVNVHSYDRTGKTPLLAMVEHLRLHDDDTYIKKLVYLLIRAGANANSRDRSGEIALHKAIVQGLISLPSCSSIRAPISMRRKQMVKELSNWVERWRDARNIVPAFIYGLEYASIRSGSGVASSALQFMTNGLQARTLCEDPQT
ncbi:MAG: hypothetical protein Q9217_002818 [Psora testacea]